jgi:hypothetical protein
MLSSALLISIRAPAGLPFEATMAVTFSCERCGKRYQVGVDLAGRSVKCKACGSVMRIPSPNVAKAPAPVEAAGQPLPRLSAPAPPAGPTPRLGKKRKPRPVVKDGWVALAIGAALAVVAFATPFVGFIPAVLMTVVHELGHAATAWLLGRPAVPSFDLTYGGGVSHAWGRQPLLLAVIYAALGALAFRYRGNLRTLTLIGITIGVYSLAAFSTLGGLLMTGMGHGLELIIAGVFLYRAISGASILHPAERPLYAFLGLFFVAHDAAFAFRLATSEEHRMDYGDAKGGGHTMDFSRIAEELLHVRLETVAGLFLIACLLPPLCAFAAHRYRGWIRSAVGSLARPSA